MTIGRWYVALLVAVPLVFLLVFSCRASGKMTELEAARLKVAVSELRRLEQIRATAIAQINAQEQPHLDRLVEICKKYGIDPSSLYQGKTTIEDNGDINWPMSETSKPSPSPTPKK